MTTPSLYSSVLRLVALRDAALPTSHGQYAHAAFLRLVQDVDPDLSAYLHAANERKVFTLSPLVGAPRAANGLIRLRAGDECELRLTQIGQPLFSTFTQRLLLGPGRLELELDQARFAITTVWTTPGSHEWAGATTADELVRQAHADRVITLQFVTPTAFYTTANGARRCQVLLSPEAVFGDLAHKWMELGFDTALDLAALVGAAPEERGPDSPLNRWRKLFASHILVREQQGVNTHVLHFEKQPHIGTTGSMSYEVFDNPDWDARQAEQLIRVVNTLADAALYFGVGHKTTMGMGQCRRMSQ